MDGFSEKNFTVVDSTGANTVAFLINKNDAEGEKAYALQKLSCTAQFEGDKIKKTFYIDEEIPEGTEKNVVLLTIEKEKALLNTMVLQSDKFFISKESAPIEFKKLYSETEQEYKDIKYTPNFQRPISIIDPETGDEVRPVLYYDDEADMVKAKIKMMPFKPYIALEIKKS